MALRINFPLLYIFSIITLLSCVIEQSAASGIKLIHRYAPESPFYNPNLTDQEIIERLNYRSITHEVTNVDLLDQEDSHLNPLYDFTLGAYLAKVTLGTFFNITETFRKSYYLVMDTTSSIIWMQCEDCKKKISFQCYPQTTPPFPNSISRSYRPLPCGKHPLCFPKDCINNLCSYDVKHEDGTYSIGYLAHEEFLFPTLTEPENTIKLVFGCGIANKIPDTKNEVRSAGSFGLGWGPHSFISQTHSTSHGRFSYCLPSPFEHKHSSSYLLYGSEVLPYSTYPNTRLIKIEGYDSYFVNLLDISINGMRLNIPSSFIRHGGHNVGNCIFSTRTTITQISAPAYQLVKQAVKRHLQVYGTGLEIISPLFGFDLCYNENTKNRGQRNLPSITFHFEGNADLVLKPDVAFSVRYDGSYSDIICLAMIASKGSKLRNIIGSSSQQDRIITYDVSNKKLYFGSQDCSWHN